MGGTGSDDLSMPRCLLECVSSFFPSDKFTRFCQWKNVELNIHVSGFRELACQGTLGKCSGPKWWLWGKEGPCWDPSRRG